MNENQLKGERASQPRRVICPSCGAKALWDATNKFRPFCSERCKLIDLGQWANESYRVAGKTVQEDTASLPADWDE